MGKIKYQFLSVPVKLGFIAYQKSIGPQCKDGMSVRTLAICHTLYSSTAPKCRRLVCDQPTERVALVRSEPRAGLNTSQDFHYSHDAGFIRCRTLSCREDVLPQTVTEGSHWQYRNEFVGAVAKVIWTNLQNLPTSCPRLPQKRCTAELGRLPGRRGAWLRMRFGREYPQLMGATSLFSPGQTAISKRDVITYS
jgi:hypothetical protein